MIAECKKQALLSLRGKWGLGASVTFLNQLVVLIGSSILYLPFLLASLYFVNTILEEVLIGFVSLLYVIMCMAFNGIIMMGHVKVFFHIAREEEVTVDFLFDYFSRFRSMFQAFKVTFFISVYTFFWSMLFIVPGIVKSFSYAMTYFILMDHPEYTVHEALAESEQMMKGQKRHLFVLSLSFLGWLLLIVVTLGIASLWVMPYYITTLAHFYTRLSQKEKLVLEQ